MLYFLHCFISHALWFEAHGTGGEVYLGCLAEYIGLVEGFHDVTTYGYGAVFLPQYHIVMTDLLEGGICQFDGTGQGVGHDADAEGCEGKGLGYHGPEHMGQFAWAEEPHA